MINHLSYLFYIRTKSENSKSYSFSETIKNNNKNTKVYSKTFSYIINDIENVTDSISEIKRKYCLNCNRVIYNKDIYFCNLDCKTNYEFKLKNKNST